MIGWTVSKRGIHPSCAVPGGGKHRRHRLAERLSSLADVLPRGPGGSTESRRFALAASTQEGATEATVRLFLHAAATDTSYLGLMTTPFLDKASKDREISVTVPRGSQPVLSMMTGVPTTPGAYSFNIALDATQSGAPLPVRITQQIPVTVNAPSASTLSATDPRARAVPSR